MMLETNVIKARLYSKILKLNNYDKLIMWHATARAVNWLVRSMMDEGQTNLIFNRAHI